MSAQPDLIVVGAGVVGLSAALAVQARGLSVTVVDREGPAAGASAGNAGAFAFTEILPLASPGLLRKAPGWLLDPLGPLAVPPAYALRIAPWMVRFWRACAPARVAHSTAAQTALMDLSRAELDPFLAATGTAHMLGKEGNLQVYEGEAEFAASLPGWAARERHGIAFRHMRAEEMATLQPGLAPRFTHGTFMPGWWSIADPKDYVLALADRFRAGGGRIERAEVVALRPAGDGVEVLTAGGGVEVLAAGGGVEGPAAGGGVEVPAAGGVLRAKRALVAAGAFSHRIARTLGDRIPLETERGYNTTLPAGALDLRVQVTFAGHGFVMSRLTSGVRVGGAVELGGLDLPPNFARADAMLTKAKAFFPALRTEGGRQWMGFRPSLPDTLPAIGTARATDRVVYAFGHGHLGLTQSPGTARLVADLVTGRPPAIDLTPFSPQRF